MHPSYRLPKPTAALVFFGIMMLILAACGQPQPQSTSSTIGVITMGDADPMLANFKKTLAELGHVEGKNVTYVDNGSVQNLEDVDAAAQRLRDAKVDLVFVFATPTARAVQKAFAGTDIPIVFLLSSNPVQDKLVASLGQPGGNITGVSLYGSEGKRLEWLHQLDPKIKRVYFPYDPRTPSSLSVLAAMQAVAPKLGIEVVEQQLVSPGGVDQALKTMPQDIDAITIAYELIANAPELSRIARERRIPLSSPGIFGVKDTGALMSFGPDLVAAGGQSARLVHKILTGTKPADIPVETADSFLKLNLQTAKAIGLTIPDAILGQAAEVVR
jgi:putative ABC transport system substrate-binding protein